MRAALLMLASAALMPTTAFAQEIGEWNFKVALDGKPIGSHRFVVSEGDSPGARKVDSRANLLVRLLGIPVYRYRHQAEERWQGDCLRELRADTDDDGQRVQVAAQRFDPPACLMGYAYWNPRLVRQQQLVDPQTSRVTAVRFERVPDASIEVAGRPVPAQGWRLLAEGQRITVWYATQGGRWIALDADAKGGRRLSYRLSSPTEESATP